MTTLTVGTNTYLTVADASTYFDERLRSDAWSAATDDDKARSLIMATAAIDSLRLRGRKIATEQALAFPRAVPGRLTVYAYLQPWPMLSTNWYVQQGVPATVCAAVCEEALALLGGADDGAEAERVGLFEEQIGSAMRRYRPTRRIHLKSVEAERLMRPHIAHSAAIAG